MKRIILLSVFLQTLFVSGQIPESIKYDALSYSYDSSSCIITKGKKQTIYNLRTESICVAPTKNFLINFPGSNVYAEIPVKPGKIIIHFLTSEKNHAFYCKSDYGIIKISNPLENSILEADGKYFDLEHDNLVDSVPPGVTDWGLHEIKKINDGVYLINSFRNGFTWMDIQDQVHQKDGINGSGLYSFTEKKWLIEPTYKYIDQLNGFLLCAEEYNVELIIEGDRIIQQEGKRYRYDIFKLNPAGVPEKIAADLNEILPDVLSKILGLDHVSNSGFSNIYQSLKSDKQGLFMFKLILSDETPKPGIQFTELFNPQFDYLHVDTSVHCFLTLNKSNADAISLYWMNKENEPVKIISHPEMVAFFIDDYYHQKTIYTPDTSIAAEDYRDSLIFYPVNYYFNLPDFGSGLKFRDDSLLIVYKSSDAEINIIESYLYPGEDSVDENSNPVYALTKPGSATTGVYNLNTKSWLVQPEYFNIIRNNQNFVSCYPSDAFYFSLNDYYYSAFNNKGDIRFEGKSAEEIYADTSLLSKIIPFENCLEIQAGSKGLLAHTQLKTDPESYYIFSYNKMGIFYPDIYLENQFENRYFEFVHYNSNLDATIFLQGDSIYFTCPNFSLTCQKNEKIIYLASDAYMDEPYKWALTRITPNKDSISLGLLENLKYDALLSYQLISDSIIIINDHSQSEGLTCVECMDEFGLYNRAQSFQTENSSVWKKTKEGWRKISPYYSTIEPVNNKFYVASSGKFKHYENGYNEDGYYKNESAVDQRFFILDNNLQALHYMDYYDFADVQDLGFGFKIKLNSEDKYFFMTYNFEALTDAEWDHFEMENGKLKAMIYTQYQINEYGEQVLDSFGMPVETVSSTTKYFKFPVK